MDYRLSDTRQTSRLINSWFMKIRTRNPHLSTMDYSRDGRDGGTFAYLMPSITPVLRNARSAAFLNISWAAKKHWCHCIPGCHRNQHWATQHSFHGRSQGYHIILGQSAKDCNWPKCSLKSVGYCAHPGGLAVSQISASFGVLSITNTNTHRMHGTTSIGKGW